jgi:hypothetical protein
MIYKNRTVSFHIMPFLYIFFALLFLLNNYACTDYKDKGDNLASIELFHKIELVKPGNGELVSFKDSVIIYKQGVYTVYKHPVLNIVTNAVMNKAQDTVREDIVEQSVTYRYIIYKRNNTYGFLYDSLNTIKPKRISIDSFKNVTLLPTFPYIIPKAILVSSLKHDEESVLTEKRIPEKIIDPTYPDTCYYSYTNKFKNAPYSFSKMLDSTRKLKLYKVVFRFKRIEKGKYPAAIPEREYYFELRKAKEAPEIPKLIEDFKKMEAKLDL